MHIPRPIAVAEARAILARVSWLAAATAAICACMWFSAAHAGVERAPAKRPIEHPPSDPTALSSEAEAEKRERIALKQHLVATAVSIVAIEARLTRLEETLPVLEREERAAARALAGRRDEVVRLLAALQRLARRPAHTPVGVLPEPVGVLRGRLLKDLAMPALDRGAQDIAAELKNLASLRDRLAKRRREHHRARRSLAEEQRVLAGLIAIRAGRGAGPREEAEPAQPAAAAPEGGIRSIGELIDRLTSARRETRLRPGDLVPTGSQRGAAAAPASAAPALPPVATPHLPAVGHVVARFGDPEKNGWTAQGITIRTRSSAQVVAPRAGTVVFAEPYLDYGELLIIDHGEGYHALLAGLERLDARVGDDLVSGEPIGIMGSETGGADRLYIELRRGGRPIDPLPWLTENRDKVGE